MSALVKATLCSLPHLSCGWGPQFLESGVSQQSEVSLKTWFSSMPWGDLATIQEQLAFKAFFVTVSLERMELQSLPNSTCFSWKQSMEMSWATSVWISTWLNKLILRRVWQMTEKYEYIYILDHICFLKQINLYICRHEIKQNNSCKILSLLGQVWR